MKRSSLRRRKPLRPRGRPRFRAGREPAYLEWVRTLPCIICNRGWRPLIMPRSEAAHVKSRGAGGGDRGNTVPLCRRHHDEQHRIGLASFERKYGIDLRYAADRLPYLYTPLPTFPEESDGHESSGADEHNAGGAQGE